ncbi:hypothetical protein [Flavobacterium suzhouense]|uniref:Uncharacterized protein n=1 Tax=Flavobacterium suzhouense TaxID=1529638 RepID=A0ABW5NUG4_9FLAO
MKNSRREHAKARQSIRKKNRIIHVIEAAVVLCILGLIIWSIF